MPTFSYLTAHSNTKRVRLNKSLHIEYQISLGTLETANTKLIEITQNISGATSFWVSTSVGESLLNAFLFVFVHEPYMTSRTHDGNIIFLIFKSFLIVFNHALCTLVEIHNNQKIISAQFMLETRLHNFAGKENLFVNFQVLT